VIAGFEAEHIFAAVYLIMRRIEEIRGGEKARAENLYPSAVRPEGNPAARRATEACFETGAAVWRGLGEIENSGYYLREEYARFDGGSRIAARDDGLPSGCECGGVITGAADPPECPMFARECTPQTPRGPCMVSAEGTCGIWYRSR
jgi:hydrogenase expression/formation protein HypD